MLGELVSCCVVGTNGYFDFRCRAFPLGGQVSTEWSRCPGSIQGRTEIRWRPGHEASLAHPCSNLMLFGKECIALKKVRATLLGVFGAPGIVPPLYPGVTPLVPWYRRFRGSVAPFRESSAG